MSDEQLVVRYFDYNPEEDYNGAQGMEIIDEVLMHCGYDLNKFGQWVEKQRRQRAIRENKPDTGFDRMMGQLSSVEQIVDRRAQAGLRTPIAISH